jgi:hypothetical protein
MSPVKYELLFYVPEDDILHSHRCEYLKSYMMHLHDYRLAGRFSDRQGMFPV